MKKYEYKTMYMDRARYLGKGFFGKLLALFGIGGGYDDTKLNKELSTLGEQGWELAGEVVKDGINGAVVAFKREL